MTSTAKQSSFADDAGKTGSITEMKRLWDMSCTLGPDFGRQRVMDYRKAGQERKCERSI